MQLKARGWSFCENGPRPLFTMKHEEPEILDVRAMLTKGVEPFPVIRARLDALAPGKTLLLIAPFFPAPLIELMREEGLEVKPMRGREGSWETTFRRLL